MKIQIATQNDTKAWESMRQELWPSPAGEHASEITRFFDGDLRVAAEVFLACDDADRALGFIELNIRPYAEGCYSGRVAYVEGWFVETPHRSKGVGAALIKAAEAWGREQNCTELASDTAIDNVASTAAHRALGFEETGRNVCFRKDL